MDYYTDNIEIKDLSERERQRHIKQLKDYLHALIDLPIKTKIKAIEVEKEGQIMYEKITTTKQDQINIENEILTIYKRLNKLKYYD